MDYCISVRCDDNYISTDDMVPFQVKESIKMSKTQHSIQEGLESLSQNIPYWGLNLWNMCRPSMLMYTISRFVQVCILKI